MADQFVHRESSYTLEQVANAAGLAVETVQTYCAIGVLGSRYRDTSRAAEFDDTAVYWLRRLERLRAQHALSPQSIALISQLFRQIEHLESEVRALRSR